VTDVSAKAAVRVIARYRPAIWLLGPIGAATMAGALAFMPYVLGYDSASSFIAEHRGGLSWAILSIIGCPPLLAIALALLIAPLRSGGVAIRDLGDALVFTGPWDLTVAKTSIQTVEIADMKPGLLVTIDGARRLIGVPFLDASPVELRRRILVAIGRQDPVTA
jgi:hypothetical protein